MGFLDSNDTLVPFRCDLQRGDLVDGNYRVEKELGKGAFGQVFLVYDNDNRPLALKILRLWEVPGNIRDSLLGRFRLEYQTARIDSPYIVSSVGFGYVNNNPYFVMEYCGGGDVNTLIGNPDTQHIVTVAEQILSGLKALHEKGLVHRDIKPENILLREDGTVAITDFGIAGDRYNRMTQRNWLGRPSQMFGTYAYMSPEQILRKRGDSTVLPTTDIFSFGVLLYQLLTGQLPFGRIDSHSDLVAYQKNVREGLWNHDLVRRLPNSRKWIQFFDHCLNPDYQRRFQTTEEARKALPTVRSLFPLKKTSGSSAVQEERHFCLIVSKGDEAGRCYDLTKMVQSSDIYTLTVGRGDNNDIQLKDSYSVLVSRHHFTITTTDQQTWIVKDGQYNPERGIWENSLNGTYINDRICDDKGSYVKNGDLIKVGNMELKFQIINN